MATIVYKDGSNYVGKYEDKRLAKWEQLGINLGQSYMYKGYRYLAGRKDIVIVYATNHWDLEEITQRRNNGFEGIKEYFL